MNAPLGQLELGLYDDLQSEKGSGVRNVPNHPGYSFEQIVSFKKDAFERALLSLEEDPRISHLMKMANGLRGTQHGPLRFFVDEMRKVQDFLFADPDRIMNALMVRNALSSVFRNTMERVVKNWPNFESSRADWHHLCSALHYHIVQIGGVFGEQDSLNRAAHEWFNNYQELQKRNTLNAQALQSHEELAGYRAMGGDNNSVIQNVRGRIAGIDSQLQTLPVDHRYAPAFSQLNPENDAMLSQQSKQIIAEKQKAQQQQSYQSGAQMTFGQQHAPTVQPQNIDSRIRQAAQHPAANQVQYAPTQPQPVQQAPRAPLPSEETTNLTRRPEKEGFWARMKRGFGSK